MPLFASLVQVGLVAVASLVRQTVTREPRLMASERARLKADSKLFDCVARRLRTKKLSKLGAAIMARMAAIAIATINSMRVKPWGFGRLVSGAGVLTMARILGERPTRYRADRRA
jgi:hypothetical protein